MLSNLTEDSDGTFYGTTAVGGYYHNGTVFNMTPDGFLFPIYEFSQYGSDGTGPSAGVIRGSDGNFYGTTSTGGHYGFGTVFQSTPYWDYTNLVSFNGTNGADPEARMVQGRDGNFYGTTFSG